MRSLWEWRRTVTFFCVGNGITHWAMKDVNVVQCLWKRLIEWVFDVCTFVTVCKRGSTIESCLGVNFRNVHLWRPSVTAVPLALFKWWDDYRRLYPRDFCLLLALFTTLLNVPISSAIYAKAGCWVNISRSLFRLPLCIRRVNSLKCATKWGLVGKSLTRNMACEMVCAHSRSPRLRAGCWLFEREH